jgi:hypothetical protein
MNNLMLGRGPANYPGARGVRHPPSTDQVGVEESAAVAVGPSHGPIGQIRPIRPESLFLFFFLDKYILLDLT